jgi:hypothetical protein
MRTKQVFCAREVFDKWANGLPSGRNSAGNTSFREGFAYSYAEPIARRLVNGKGTIVFLFRNRSFSPTTSKHQAYARRAVPGNPFVFHVAHIGASSSWESGYTLVDGFKLDHKRNLKTYADSIASSAAALSKSRSHIESRLRGLRLLVEEANRYAGYFHLKTRFAVPELDLETLHERHSRYEEARAAQRAARDARYAAIAEQTRKDNAEKIAAWIAGERITLAYGLDRDYLRTEGTETVTSRGSRVPVDHVKRALRVVARLLERGETYQRNGHSIHVGDYVLDSIDAAGLVRVGCHRFLKEEVMRYAATLTA